MARATGGRRRRGGLPRRARAPLGSREAAVGGSGGACGNWGNLAPLRPPPEREKMPTHSGAGHDGRGRAGAELHFPAASSPPRQGKERAPCRRVGPAALAKPQPGSRAVNHRGRIRALAAVRGRGREGTASASAHWPVRPPIRGRSGRAAIGRQARRPADQRQRQPVGERAWRRRRRRSGAVSPAGTVSSGGG